MPESLIIDFSIVLLLGLAAQWIAWRFHLPAILLLLVFGLVAGPGIGLLHPDELMGPMLVPVVSLSVALILFEGGMSLKLRELKTVGKVVRNLVTIGVIASWVLISLAAWLIIGLDIGLASLLGAVLVVTGPTVIGPLLRHVRPRGQVGPTLKWEGIYIDPIGALLAVLVFEALLAGSLQHAGIIVVSGILRTIVVGVVVGGIAAALLVLFLRRNWIPEFLDNPAALILVIAAFSISNVFQEESGLFTVTLMGTLLTNQTFVSVKHITRFKEDLRVLLISFLFVILAARLNVADLKLFGAGSILFLAVLIVLIRPASVWLCTRGSKLSRAEKTYLSFIAPRGIVAAAVASVFALKLDKAGYPGADMLVPMTFLVIIGTVFIYGIIASPLARYLKLALPNPQGILILGAHDWARTLGQTLKAENVPVLLVDTNRTNIQAARMDGLPAYHGNILMPDVREDIDLGGIGKMMALTPNDGANSLAAIECMELFERQFIFQLAPTGNAGKEKSKEIPHHLHGRYLFGKDMTYKAFSSLLNQGFVIKKTKLNKEFTYKDFQAAYGDMAKPLVLVMENRNTQILAAGSAPLNPKPGSTIISLVPAELSGNPRDQQAARDQKRKAMDQDQQDLEEGESEETV